MGVADHVLESISGQLSRRMLEHSSHVRIDAKRQALDSLCAARHNAAGTGTGRGLLTATAAKAVKTGQARGLTPSSRCPTSSRHSHVTVCG
jgi:hypothetical protein